MTSVKIFVSTRIDKNVEFIDNSLYIPVRCGAYFDENHNSPILGDNSGMNISEKRDSFCELTVLYWAWKNQKADYYGLCHYRRYLSFSAKKYNVIENDEHSNGCVSEKKLSTDIINKYKLTDTKTLEQLLYKTDAIFIFPIELKKYGCSSNYDAMQKAPLWHNMNDVNIALDIIKEKYPQIYETAKEYMFNYDYSYLYNCFIMEKKTFHQYCSWLFDILFELEKRIDMSSYTQQMSRSPASIAERLTGIWALWMQKNNKKIKNLPIIYFEDVEQKEQSILPAFDGNNIALGVSCSNEYIPYLSVYLQSVIEHTDVSKNYDIIVLERSISAENKEILKKQIAQKNVSLRFVNPLPFLQKYDLKFSGHYNLECYFRLCAPLILKGYDKVIFTDCDLVFNEDPAKLYDIDISKYPLAACKDLMFGSFLNYPNSDWKHYSQKELELKYPYEYFNTGVMVLNIKKFNENNWSKAMLELVSQKQFRILEQDGLNCFFKNSIKYIPTAWNFPVDIKPYISLVPYMPAEFENQYRKDKKNPFIIHWAGNGKPWNDPTETMADIWWQYARKTPFYEEILLRMVHAHQLADNPIGNIITNSNYNRDQKLKYVLMHPLYFLLKKFKYKIKKNLVIGERKSKAKQKYKNVKALLKDAKKLKKNLKKI